MQTPSRFRLASTGALSMLGVPASIDPITWRWWTGLRFASVLNLVAFGVIAASPATDAPFRKAQLLCAGIYVAVCAFRSFLPRVDIERRVLVDHWLSSVVLGRSLATVAEMAFTVQCALLFERLAMAGAPAFLREVALAIVPLITVAQICCWRAVLTCDHRWHAAEEALWGLGTALGVLAFAAT